MAAGCGSGPRGLVPVAGKVTVAGRPLTKGTVTLRPDASRGNTSQFHPTGVVDAQGNYYLVTGKSKGAPPGWYKVLVFASAPGDASQTEGGPPPPRWLTDVKYTHEDTTDRTIEVRSGAPPGEYDLRLSK
jgi:hypothetical protein